MHLAPKGEGLPLPPYHVKIRYRSPLHYCRFRSRFAACFPNDKRCPVAAIGHLFYIVYIEMLVAAAASQDWRDHEHIMLTTAC